jgi:cob(I)alamin adenosyltransferase
MLNMDDCLDRLKKRPPEQHVVITGRYAPQELIDSADLVTEMREIKHPLKTGIKAQKGIEF